MYDMPVEVRDVTLADLLDRVFDQGVVLAGDITISVADVDLISLRLAVLLASVERVAELGMQAATSGPNHELTSQ
ncbi:MAG TPA: gas vesicle protein [Thermomicrobiaceae bacterium]|nr:gas vesicle protein [Thermomicrobiaceae bacterium]